MEQLSLTKDKFAAMMFGMTTPEAQTKNICISCKKEIHFHDPFNNPISYEESEEGDVYSYQGLKEYKISGMCEHCFDKSFADEE